MKSVLFSLVFFFVCIGFGQKQTNKNLASFVPKGYNIFDTIYGDLNNDGLEDCVLIIKGTDTNQVVNDEYRDKLDQNRRGVLIVWNNKDHYELALKNLNCFSSENKTIEEPFSNPELVIEIENSNLLIHRVERKYDYLYYTFKFQNSDFELIKYNKVIGKPEETETIINFQTQTKTQHRANNSSKEKIKIKTHIKLSQVKDFDTLNTELNFY